MTRKDYELIASILKTFIKEEKSILADDRFNHPSYPLVKDGIPVATLSRCIHTFAHHFRQDNERFDNQTFLDAIHNDN